MSSQQLLLDTDNLSLLMRQNAAVVAKGNAYLAEHQNFTISIVTRYEILRGLKAKGADQQASRFEAFCVRNRILAMTDDVVLRATDIYRGSVQTRRIDRRRRHSDRSLSFIERLWHSDEQRRTLSPDKGPSRHQLG